MNAAHWHLVVNHIPIIFPMVGIMIMFMGLISKSEAVKRTALIFFIVGAIGVLAATETGELAEDVVENLIGVTNDYIEIHEKKAKTFAMLSYTLCGISILGLWASFKQKTFSSIVFITTLIYSLVVLFYAIQTGKSGGEIRHTEIRSGSTISDMMIKTEEEDD